MSTAITALYDGMVTIVGGLFTAPTYKELVNPYIPEFNDSLSLARGYGFVIGAGDAQPQNLGRYEAISRTIEVTQTIVNRGTERDATIRRTAEKNLLEDQYLLVDYFRQNTAPIAKVWNIAYQSDGGLEFVLADNQNYIMIKTTLRATYSEAC